jgi:hypothetical protein
MQADFSRVRFDPARHYSGVRQQQGRVLLDADWNEQTDIQAHRVEAEAADLIGPSGAPWHPPGTPRNFQVLANGTDFTVAAGHFYLDGILCENETDAAGSSQPQLTPGAPVVRLPGGVRLPLPAPAGTYLAYLDVWQRHVTELDDPDLHEPALGDVDTTTRTMTAWQAYLLQVPPGTTCPAALAEWDALVAGGSGKLRARSRPGGADTNSCAVPPGGGYRRLENQLYRVEIHDPGPPGTATFKWSRDNASVVARWLARQNDDLTVSRPSRDAVLGFGGQPFVELSDDSRALQARPGTLVQLDRAEGEVLTIKPLTATGPVDLAAFPVNATVRRWDSPGALKVEVPATNDGWIPLEDGVEVRFEPGEYQTGDHWLIPARTAVGDVLWPRTGGAPDARPRHGTYHHFTRLALLQAAANGQLTVLSDCRSLFPPLSGLTHLVYVGGDGQEARPGQELAGDLEVGVVNGAAPVAGALVRFEIVEPAGGGDGTLTADGTSGPVREVHTGADGTARCRWRPATSPPAQQVNAVLRDAVGAAVGLPVHFRANLSIAGEVAYDRAGCPDMPTSVATVQDAIDFLCKQKRGGGCAVTVGQGGQYTELKEALHDLIVVKKLPEVCLCLLPGTHALSQPGPVEPTGEKLSLRMTGCGPGTLLRLDQQLSFRNLDFLNLSHLAVEGEPVQKLISVEGCARVEVLSCRLQAKGPAPTALEVVASQDQAVRVEGNELLSLRTSSAPAELALLLNARGDVWLRGNQLNAPLALYGLPEMPTRPPLNLDDLSKLREKKKSLVFPANLQRGLWVSDNQLDRIALSGEIVDILRSAANSPPGGVVQMPEVHAIAVFANNHIQSMFNGILARHVAVSGNSFEVRTDPHPDLLLYASVVAERGSLVGNVASFVPSTGGVMLAAFGNSTSEVQEAANVMNVQIV